MNALICELCGGNDIIKQDGYYVCQNCGTKYTPEEAKKIMIEGPVDVSGSVVKVDKSDELKNLYELARRARDDNNSVKAEGYYNKILLKDPNSWEANFYSVYFQSANCKIANIKDAANNLANSEISVLSLVKNEIQDETKQKRILLEIRTRLMTISKLMFDSARKNWEEMDLEIREKDNFLHDMYGRCLAAELIIAFYANLVIANFGEKFGEDISVPCWKQAIDEQIQLLNLPFSYNQRALNKQLGLYEKNQKRIQEYTEKIQKYETTFESPNTEIPKGGCYVATAIYGSYDCPEVWTLRRYRDNTLAGTWYGRAFIHTYYAISPTLVKWFGQTDWFRNMWKPKLDKMVDKLQKQGVADTPYQDKNWK